VRAQDADGKAARTAPRQQIIGGARFGLARRHLGQLGATWFGNGLAHDLDGQPGALGDA
jgi:hypothetical protein